MVMPHLSYKEATLQYMRKLLLGLIVAYVCMVIGEVWHIIFVIGAVFCLSIKTDMHNLWLSPNLDCMPWEKKMEDSNF